MLVEFLTVSGWIFWAVIAFVLILDIFWINIGDSDHDSDFFGWAVFWSSAAFILTVCFTDAFRGLKWWMLLAGLVAYLIIGVLWSFKKWIDHIKDVKAKIRSRSSNKNIAVLDDAERPKAYQSKKRLTSWMTLWPLSMSWWLLTWPRRAAVWVYERLSTVYERVSKRIWEMV